MATVNHDRLRAQIEELKTLKDEIRVRLELAKMDLRDEWKLLEKRLPDSASLASEIKSGTAEALESLTEELRRFRDRVRPSGGSHS